MTGITAPLELEVHANFAECEDVLRAFNSKVHNKNPFLEVDWLKEWWRYFGKSKSLYLIVIRDGGNIIGFVPFYRVHRSIIGIYEFRLLGEGISSYLDFLCSAGYEGIVTDSLFNHFNSLPYGVIVQLRDINDRFSRFFLNIRERSRDNNNNSSSYKLYPCPIAILGSSWEKFFKERRDRKSRYNLQRAERLFSKLGKLKLREVTSTEVAHLFPQLERIHRERFLTTENPLFKGPRRRFIESVFQKMIGFTISLSIEELDGVPLSFLWGFKMGEVFIDFAPAFDPAFASLSLGNIHLMRLIEKKIAEGFKYFDFSKGEADYKRWWSNDETSNYLFRFNFNLKIMGYCYYKLLNYITELLLEIRTRGYNKKIKNWIANWRNLRLLKPRVTVNVEEITLPSDFDVTKCHTWSYQLIRELPVAVRKPLIDYIVKSRSNILWIKDFGNRSIAVICEDISKGYKISY